jgi:hypothetical protein
MPPTYRPVGRYYSIGRTAVKASSFGNATTQAEIEVLTGEEGRKLRLEQARAIRDLLL